MDTYSHVLPDKSTEIAQKIEDAPSSSALASGWHQMGRASAQPEPLPSRFTCKS
jgi:hypothetical protein